MAGGFVGVRGLNLRFFRKKCVFSENFPKTNRVEGGHELENEKKSVFERFLPKTRVAGGYQL